MYAMYAWFLIDFWWTYVDDFLSLFGVWGFFSHVSPEAENSELLSGLAELEWEAYESNGSLACAPLGVTNLNELDVFIYHDVSRQTTHGYSMSWRFRD